MTPTPGKPPGNQDFAAQSPPPSPSGSGSSSGNGFGTDNTPNPSGAGPGHIPLSAIQYDPNGFNNGQAALETYLNQALDVMGITNQAARQNWINGFLVAANRESSFQAGAVNKTDGNAVGPTQSDGAPAGSSRGLLQDTPEVFADFHQTGTSDNIYNPVANITASMNYVMARYGVNKDGSNLGNVAQFNPNDAPQGY
jgi:hypothetical protein